MSSTSYRFIIEGVDNASNTFRNVGQAAEQTNQSFKNLVVSASGLATSSFNLYLNFDRIQKSQVQLDRSNLMVQRSTESLDQATKTYNETIEKYGILSPEAKDASDKLEIAQEALSVATDRAELAQGNLNNTMATFALSILPTLITGASSISVLIKNLEGLTATMHLTKAAALGVAGGIGAIAIAGAVLAPYARQAALDLRKMVGLPEVSTIGGFPTPVPVPSSTAGMQESTSIVADLTNAYKALNAALTQTTSIVSEINEVVSENQRVFNNLIRSYNVEQAQKAGKDFVEAYTKALESGSMLRAFVVAARFATAMKIDLQDAVNILDEGMRKIQNVVAETDEAQLAAQRVFDKLIRSYNVEQAVKAGKDFVEAYTKAWESGSMLRAFMVAVRFATTMKIDLQDAVNILDELMRKIEAIPTQTQAPTFQGVPSAETLAALKLAHNAYQSQFLEASVGGPELIVPLNQSLGGGGVTEITINIEGPVVNIQGDASRQTAARAASMVQETLKNITLEASSSAADTTHKQIRVNNTVVTGAGGGTVVGGQSPRSASFNVHRERFRE